MITKEQLGKSLEIGAREHEEVEEGWVLRCMEARKYGLRGVVATSYNMRVIQREMEGSGIPIVGIFAFPMGIESTKMKVMEALDMLERGADGLDGVINYQAIKCGDNAFVADELEKIVEAVRKEKPNVEIKFIIETNVLSTEETITAARLVKASGANFVKTGTGTRGGCTVEQIRILREAVGPEFGVKAAGGTIATTEKALAMLDAGADVIGENNCCQIMEGYDLLVEERARGNALAPA